MLAAFRFRDRDRDREGIRTCRGDLCVGLNPVAGARKLGAVGPTLRGRQIALVTEDRTLGARRAAGGVVIKSDNMMRGDLDNPEETARNVKDGLLHMTVA